MKTQKPSFLLLFVFLFTAAFAEPPASKVLYIGAVSINPCQEAKILADWYARLGIETKEFRGMYFGKIETAAGTVSFAIHAKKKDAPAKSSASVAVVFRVENFDESVAAAKAKGLAPDSVEGDAFGKFAHYHDPDGNEVTLWGK